MNLSSQSKPLQTQVIHAGFWSFLLHGAGRVLGFVRTLVIARLLAPEDIGLFALAALVLSVIETLSRSGFHSALIHQSGAIEHELSIAWTSHVIRGSVRAVVIFLLAPAFADFFKQPVIEPFIRVIALSVFINGFTNTGVFYFKKRLEFHKEFVFSLSSTLADIIVSVVLSIYLKQAWALIYGIVARHVVELIMSFLLHPFRPRFCFDRSTFSRMVRFGIWLNLTGIMLVISGDGVRLVVGKVLNAHVLGLYQMAHWLTQSLLVEVMAALNEVAFSAYATLQQEPERLRTAFIKTAGFKVSLIIPATTLIVLLADIFVQIFLGQKWLGMVEALRILAVAGCFYSIAISGRPVFLGLGSPRTLFFMHSLGAGVVLVFVYPLTVNLGITGAAIAMLLSGLTMLIFSYAQIKIRLQLSRNDLLQLLAPALIVSLVLGAVIMLAFYFFVPRHDLTHGLADTLFFVVLLLVNLITAVVVFRLVEPLFPANQPVKAFGVFWR